MSRLLEEAKKMIRINSVTSNGNEELTEFLAAAMQQRGLKVQTQLVTHSLENVSKRQFNLIGILGDPLVDSKTKKGLLLNTHLDTVNPGVLDHWTETDKDPFQATVKDGKIFGLGTADVKLDFLCKLHAVEKFRERKLKMPIYLVGTCGEETGMFGAKYLIKSKVLNPKYVVVGEPSELKVVFAHKYYAIYKMSLGVSMVEKDAKGFNRRIKLFVTGKSAHGSYPSLGQNALELLLGVLDAAFAAGYNLQVTDIEGGDAINKVPDRASAEFYLNAQQFEDFKRFFREKIKADGTETAFRAEIGGLGNVGAKFFPEGFFNTATESVNVFKKLSQEWVEIVDQSYKPAHSTVNFSKLQMRPGFVDFYFDLRVLPSFSMPDLHARIQKDVQALGAKYPKYHFNVSRERMNPALNMTTEHELVKYCQAALRDAGIEPVFDKKATSTEAAQYFQEGHEAVVFGPGISAGNSHSPNEHNLLEHLEKATLFYEKLIERVCL